jgi:hypothetical protein
MATGNKRIEKQINNVLVDKEFIRCEQNSIWPFTNGLQKMLKWPSIAFNS